MALQWAGERYILVYNGELYNTAELRGELEGLGHEFQDPFGYGGGPARLRRVGSGGPGPVQRLFAFALWMERAEKLLLARDRMG